MAVEIPYVHDLFARTYLSNGIQFNRGPLWSTGYQQTAAYNLTATLNKVCGAGLCSLKNIFIVLCSVTKLPRKQHKLGSITYSGLTSDFARPRDNEGECGDDPDKHRLTGKTWIERAGFVQASQCDVHSRKMRAHSPIHPGLAASRVPSESEPYIRTSVGVNLTKFSASYPASNGLWEVTELWKCNTRREARL
jgi:hypothetical protein